MGTQKRIRLSEYHLAPEPKRERGRPAYAPTEQQLDAVELMAANRVKQRAVMDWLGIGESTFYKYFSDRWRKGQLDMNLKVTRSLLHAAVGHEGVLNPEWVKARRIKDPAKRELACASLRKWLELPREPETAAAIWWDKTRNGMTERSEVKHTGKAQGGITNVLVMLPSNGRETGADGDPGFSLARQQKLIEVSKKANGHDG